MFYNNYVDLCNKIGKSPSAAAEDMGFKRSVVTRWSKGTEPRQATLQRIAEYFDVSVDVLVAEQKETPTVSGEGLDPITKELFDIVDAASCSERQMMLEMLKVLKRGGK